MAGERRDRGAAIDQAAGDRAGMVMVVFIDRRDEAGGIAILFEKTVIALHQVPAVIVAAGGGRHDGHLFPVVLADIGDIEQIAVERHAPRIAKAPGPDSGRASASPTNGLSGGIA